MTQLFDYIVGYYVKKNDEEIVKAGFTKLEDAEDFINHWDTLFMPIGFIYIDAPEGKYIYAETGWNTTRSKLFLPSEWKKAYIYDASLDQNVRINEFLPFSRYNAISEQNNTPS